MALLSVFFHVTAQEPSSLHLTGPLCAVRLRCAAAWGARERAKGVTRAVFQPGPGAAYVTSADTPFEKPQLLASVTLGKLGKKCGLPVCPERRSKSGEPVVTLHASVAGPRGIPGPRSWPRSPQAASPNGEPSLKISTCVGELERLQPREGQDLPSLALGIPGEVFS